MNDQMERAKSLVAAHGNLWLQSLEEHEQMSAVGRDGSARLQAERKSLAALISIVQGLSSFSTDARSVEG